MVSHSQSNAKVKQLGVPIQSESHNSTCSKIEMGNCVKLFGVEIYMPEMRKNQQDLLSGSSVRKLSESSVGKLPLSSSGSVKDLLSEPWVEQPSGPLVEQSVDPMCQLPPPAPGIMIAQEDDAPGDERRRVEEAALEEREAPIYIGNAPKSWKIWGNSQLDMTEIQKLSKEERSTGWLTGESKRNKTIRPRQKDKLYKHQMSGVICRSKPDMEKFINDGTIPKPPGANRGKKGPSNAAPNAINQADEA